MQTFLFMATLAQSLIHWIYHKPSLKCYQVHCMSFNSFRKVSFTQKTSSQQLSQHKDSQSVSCFYRITSCTFSSPFILSADHTDRKWPWYDDVLGSSVHSCSLLYITCVIVSSVFLRAEHWPTFPFRNPLSTYYPLFSPQFDLHICNWSSIYFCFVVATMNFTYSHFHI